MSNTTKDEFTPLTNQVKQKSVEDSPPLFSQMLPESLEDENFIIYSMFYSLERAERVANRVEIEDFNNALNLKVFAICLSLTDAGEIITSHSIRNEFTRKYVGAWESMPFDIPTVWELDVRYNKTDFAKIPEGGLDGSIRRVKQDRLYREIIYRANDALLMARAREGDPQQIIAPLEELATDIQKTKGSVVIWADEAERQAQERYTQMDNGTILTIPTGFPEVDRKLWGGGKAKGDLVIVSGVTSGGKTTYCLNMSDNAAELGIPNIYFSTEMEVFKIFSRQHSAKAKIPGYKIRPNMTEIYPDLNIRQKLFDSGADMAKRPIGYSNQVRDMDTLRRVLKFYVREAGVQEAYIDLLGHFKPTKNFRGSPYERASLNAEIAKEIAQELDIVLTACVQLRRKDKSEKGGKDSYKQDTEGNLVEPTLDMLKNSGELENSADTVIFLWGEKGKEGEEDAIRDIYGRVAKQRQGVLFPFELKFAPSIFTFTSMEKLIKLRQQMEEAEL